MPGSALRKSLIQRDLQNIIYILEYKKREEGDDLLS